MSVMSSAWKKDTASNSKTSGATSSDDQDWPSLNTVSSSQPAKPSKGQERRYTEGSNVDDKNVGNKTRWENITIPVIYNSTKKNLSTNGAAGKPKSGNKDTDDKENMYKSKSKAGQSASSEGAAHRPNSKIRSNTRSANKNPRNVSSGNGVRSYQAAGFQFLPLYPANPGSHTSTLHKDQPPPSGPPAGICVLPPGTDSRLACSILIRQQLARQIDFYFSPDNLAHDIFLRKNMDTEGWVPLSTIAKFNRIATLCSDIDEITEAVCECCMVEVDKDKRRVRCLVQPTIWVFNREGGSHAAELAAPPPTVSKRSRTISNMSEPDDLDEIHLQRLLIIAPNDQESPPNSHALVDIIQNHLATYAKDVSSHDESVPPPLPQQVEPPEGQEQARSDELKKIKADLAPLDVNTHQLKPMVPGPHSAPLPVHPFRASQGSFTSSVFPRFISPQNVFPTGLGLACQFIPLSYFIPHLLNYADLLSPNNHKIPKQNEHETCFGPSHAKLLPDRTNKARHNNGKSSATQFCTFGKTLSR
ncbi:La ribonucleoprotein domain member 1 [Cichlidogyrus casuarinus]|uniref:La ribonucleoprotein domain member 1 n=1 Tax=Cichlidogyrus casuarinus TaxID=1844966 RepID=A0ABD2QLB2_9PLAT